MFSGKILSALLPSITKLGSLASFEALCPDFPPFCDECPCFIICRRPGPSSSELIPPLILAIDILTSYTSWVVVW